MIRVLHMIASLEIGGSQSIMMNIYRNIDRSIVQFDFVVDHPEQMYFADEIKCMGGKIYVMPTFRGTNSIEILRKWDSFFERHKEYGIFHCHSRSYAFLLLHVAKRNGLLVIAHSHNTSNGSGVKAAIKKVLQYPLRYQADYYMACSREAGRWRLGME